MRCFAGHDFGDQRLTTAGLDRPSARTRTCHTGVTGFSPSTHEINTVEVLSTSETLIYNTVRYIALNESFS